MAMLRVLPFLTLFLAIAPVTAGDKPPPADLEQKSVAELAEQAKKSIAVLLYTGRDGKQHGLGTGFVVAPTA